MSKEKIVKELKDQIECCESAKENMDEASWRGQGGVLLTGNMAKEVLKLLEKKNE